MVVLSELQVENFDSTFCHPDSDSYMPLLEDYKIHIDIIDVNTKVEEDVNTKVEEDVNKKVEEDVNTKVEEDVNTKVEEDVNRKVEEDVNRKVEEDVNTKKVKSRKVNRKVEEDVNKKKVKSRKVNTKVEEKSSDKSKVRKKLTDDENVLRKEIKDKRKEMKDKGIKEFPFELYTVSELKKYYSVHKMSGYQKITFSNRQDAIDAINSINKF